jgi:hypothetical protein
VWTAFFQCEEYLVLPSMLSAPVFYTRLWHRGLGAYFPHTLRVVLQARDLLCYVLVALGITAPDKKLELLDVMTTLLRHAASVYRAEVAPLLTGFRMRCSEAFKILAQWRKGLLDSADAVSEGAGTAGTSSSAVAAEDSVGSERWSEKHMALFEEKLSAALDAFKALLAGTTGEVEVGRARGRAASKELHDILLAYTHLRTLVALSQARHHAAEAAASMATALRTPALGEVLRASLLPLMTDNPGGEPQADEAQRQLLFFCNSLRNRWMPDTTTVRRMRTVTSFTPHYAEDVTYSESQLKNLEHRAPSATFCHLLPPSATFCHLLAPFATR